MSRISEMVDDILRREGGYVDHPDDRGGPTKYGITQKTLSEWREHWVSKREVLDLTEDEARDIYLEKYLKAPKIHMLRGSLQPQLFDCSINHGAVRAIKFLQKVVTAIGVAYLKVDGINGPKTRRAVDKAVRRFGDYDFLNKLIAYRRVEFYCHIVSNDPTQEVFLRGWGRRAEEFAE